MGSIWTSLFSFAIFTIIFGIGNVVSDKTKGLVSSIVVGCVFYLVGFWTGVIPADSVSATGLPAMMGAFGVAILITNLGAMLNLGDFLKEWKTVLVALFGLVGLAIGSFTISSLLFGKAYALAAASPISGGIIAGIITNEYAVAAGRPDIGGFVMLLVGFQLFIGMPISSYLLKREANRILKTSAFAAEKTERKPGKQIGIRFIPEMPKSMRNSTVYLAKLAIVAVIAYTIAQWTRIPGSSPTNYYLNPNIAYLLFGILFAEIGFLDRQSLSKAGCSSFLMLAIVSIIPGSLASITLSVFIEMIIPIIGTLIVGAAIIMIFCAILGKFFGYSPALSMAIGLTALVAYPGTQIITEEVVRNLECNEEERASIMKYLLPKMLVGGFTTVTIASVFFAGIIGPMIFS